MEYNTLFKRRWISKNPPPTGSIKAFSTDAGQTAPDGDGGNSIYTVSLAKNMLLEDTSIDQVFRNVRAEVLVQTDGAQRPVEATQLTGQTFYLSKRNYDIELKEADNLISNKKIDEAIFLLNSLLKSTPDNFRLIDKLAKAYIQKANSDQEYKLAEDFLNQYILPKISDNDIQKKLKYSPGLSLLYYRKSRLIYFKSSEIDWGQYFLNIEMAKKYDPEYPYLDYYLATTYFELYHQGDKNENLKIASKLYKNTIEKYKSYLEYRPLDEESFFYLGYCYFNESKYDLAFDAFRSVLKLNKKNVYYNKEISSTYKKYADKLFDKKDLENSKYYYILAAETDSSNAYPYVGLSNISTEKEDYEDAIYNLNRAIEIDKLNAYFYYARHIANMNLGLIYDAISDLNIAAELDYDNSLKSRYFLYINIAANYLKLNQKEKALENYLKEIEVSKNYPDPYFELAEFYKSNGDNENAETNYNKAIEIDSLNHELYAGRGLFYSDNLNDHFRALADYNKGIELNPTYERLHFSKAYVYKNYFDKPGFYFFIS